MCGQAVRSYVLGVKGFGAVNTTFKTTYFISLIRRYFSIFVTHNTGYGEIYAVLYFLNFHGCYIPMCDTASITNHLRLVK